MAEFAADPDPTALAFRDFLVTWAEHAEEIRDRWEADQKGDGPLSPGRALNTALEYTEISQDWISTANLGMALIVLGTHWDYNGTVDEFYDSLTPIEQHLFAEIAAIKYADLQDSAEVVSDAK